MEGKRHKPEFLSKQRNWIEDNVHWGFSNSFSIVLSPCTGSKLILTSRQVGWSCLRSKRTRLFVLPFVTVNDARCDALRFDSLNGSPTAVRTKLQFGFPLCGETQKTLPCGVLFGCLDWQINVIDTSHSPSSRGPQLRAADSTRRTRHICAWSAHDEHYCVVIDENRINCRRSSPHSEPQSGVVHNNFVLCFCAKTTKGATKGASLESSAWTKPPPWLFHSVYEERVRVNGPACQKAGLLATVEVSVSKSLAGLGYRILPPNIQHPSWTKVPHIQRTLLEKCLVLWNAFTPRLFYLSVWCSLSHKMPRRVWLCHFFMQFCCCLLMSPSKRSSLAPRDWNVVVFTNGSSTSSWKLKARFACAKFMRFRTEKHFSTFWMLAISPWNISKSREVNKMTHGTNRLLICVFRRTRQDH